MEYLLGIKFLDDQALLNESGSKSLKKNNRSKTLRHTY